MKIYDCFMFFDEFDALEIRLQELSPVVDRFVLVEATTTHSGEPKPLYFQESSERYRQYESQLTVVAVNDLPTLQNRWIAEHLQRNAIMRGLARATADDIVIVSDCDEIPRATVVRGLSERVRRTGDIVALEMDAYYYALNLKSPERWSAVRCTRRSTLDFITPQELRMQYVTSAVSNAGWHFSYLAPEMARVDKIAGKAAAFAHGELDQERLVAEDRLRDVLERDELWWSDGSSAQGRRLLHRVAVDDSFPVAVTSDRGRWSSYVLAGAGDWRYELKYRNRARWSSRVARWRRVLERRLDLIREFLERARSSP